MANSNIEAGGLAATLRDVTVTYDGYQTRALARVSFDVRRGEVLGVLGAKGAGKSTVMKILSGRIGPTEGKAKVFGRVARSGAARARIGYLPGRMDSERTRSFFQRVFEKKEPAATARGVGRLTQAILGSRDLLVLDDAFEGLSAEELAEAGRLVREMAARGKTVVLSSDALMTVRDLCGRFAVLHEGRVQAVGTLEELLSAGGAVRFLPAVLPGEMVDKVLNVLRGEILKGTIPRTEAGSTERKPEAVSEKILTQLAEPKESAPPVGVPKEQESIDHKKLHELTKPAKPK